MLQSGRILEQGKHEQLMQNPNGAYAQLVRAREQEQPAAEADPDAVKVVPPRKSVAVRKSMSGPRKSMAARKSMAPGVARKSVAPGAGVRKSVYARGDEESGGVGAPPAGAARRGMRSSVAGVEVAGQAFGRMRASVFGGY